MACVLYTCLRCDHYQRDGLWCEKCGFEELLREYDDYLGDDEDDGRDEEE